MAPSQETSGNAEHMSARMIVAEGIIAYPEGVAAFSRLALPFPRYRVVSDRVQVAPEREVVADDGTEPASSAMRARRHTSGELCLRAFRIVWSTEATYPFQKS